MGWTEWHGFGRTGRNLVCMTGLGSCSRLLGHHASLDVGEKDTRGTATFMFVTNYVISLDPQGMRAKEEPSISLDLSFSSLS